MPDLRESMRAFLVESFGDEILMDSDGVALADEVIRQMEWTRNNQWTHRKRWDSGDPFEGEEVPPPLTLAPPDWKP